MHSHLPPPVVYNCIIPVEEAPFTSSATYHSPFDDPEGIPQKLTFPSYPDIRKSSQPLCIPTLRAVYYPIHYSNLTLNEIQKSATLYLSKHLDDPTLIEQIAAANRIHVRAFQQLIDTGKLPQKYTVSAIVNSFITPIMKSLKKAEGFIESTAASIIWQSQIHGALPIFYGASDAFAYAHEFAHRIAILLRSGILIDEQAVHIYRALDMLMINPEISSDEVTQIWKSFESKYNNLKNLCKKFEPIEEIFATYLGLLLSPPTVREDISDKIELALIKKNWYETYKVFAEACDTCQVNTPIGAALAISELACRYLEHVDINATSVIQAAITLFKIVWETMEKEEEEPLTEEEKSAINQRLCKSLNQVGIPIEVIELVDESDMSNWERLSEAVECNFSRPEDKELFPPVIMLIGRLSYNHIFPFVFPDSDVEDSNGFSPYEKAFLDSLRQQLALFFTVAHQRLTLQCELVCPFAWQGKPCCGSMEKLSRLYNRLPEEVRIQVTPPNCDLIR